MSNIFKRPMFRKGGSTGGGIMNNVIERGQYADSNADDLGIKTDTQIKDLSIGDKINLVESLGGDNTGIGDPLTQFLLQVGPNIATQTGKGGIIPNLLEASKAPITDLIKAQRDRRKTKQAIGLEFIKDLSESDKIALQEQIEYLMSPEGGGFSKVEAFNRLKPEFRKRKDPIDAEAETVLRKINDIIEVTSSRVGPTITSDTAELIYNDEQRLKDANPEAYDKFLRIRGKDKYTYSADEYEGSIDQEGGAPLKDGGNLSSLPENTYIYDITSGNFIYRQGKRVFKFDLDVKEE